MQSKVLILDFGSQVTKLIARRVREIGVLSLIVNLKEFNKINDFNIRNVGHPSQ